MAEAAANDNPREPPGGWNPGGPKWVSMARPGWRPATAGQGGTPQPSETHNDKSNWARPETRRPRLGRGAAFASRRLGAHGDLRRQLERPGDHRIRHLRRRLSVWRERRERRRPLPR